MPSNREIGQKMAEALLSELEIPDGMKSPSDKKLVIVSDVPSEGKFFEYQENHVKIYPTKEALLEDLFQNKQSTIAFCCMSLRTDVRISFDIDHVFPRAKITQKQRLLLAYLNEPTNREVAQAFMGENPSDPALQGKIGQYFKRDSSGNIRGTQWFFEVCYNNLNNLAHLKNYLNRGKSAEAPKEWFINNFPSNFNSDIEAKGGINEGVIMQQIFSTNGLDAVEIGKDDAGHPVIVYLHDSTSEGLGKFMRDWFKANADNIITESKKINDISNQLTTMLQKNLEDCPEKQEVDKFLSTINEALKIADSRSNLGEASSDDSEASGEIRRDMAYESIIEVFKMMHEFKQMKKQLLPLVVESEKQQVIEHFYKFCMKYLFSLDPEGFKIAFNYFKDQCNQKRQANASLSELQEIETLVKHAGEKGSPNKARELLKEVQRENEELKKVREENEKLQKELADLKRKHPESVSETLNPAMARQSFTPGYDSQGDQSSKKAVSSSSPSAKKAKF